MDDDPVKILADAWTRTAAEYNGYMAHRFAPWLRDAVGRLVEVDLPPGAIVVPCCGPAHEVDLVVEALPDRHVVGVDASAGMLAIGRQRLAGQHRVELREGDASDLSQLEPAGGILSTFGLQQIPDPIAAISSWAQLLAPGGRASVLFWDPRPIAGDESDDLFLLLVRLMRTRANDGDIPSWPSQLTSPIESAGCTVVADQWLSHPMQHESAQSLWEVMFRLAPFQLIRRRIGDSAVEEVKSEFFAAAPSGPITHHPKARQLIFDRPRH